MALNNNKIQQYLKKLRMSPCPLCGSNNWTMNDKCYIALEVDDRFNTTTTGFPIAFLYCNSCGCCHPIAAKAAGLI